MSGVRYTEMNIENRPLFIFTGPTCVGKTEIAHQIALKINAEIISADSRQIYKYMDIGTAKPPLNLRLELPYYLIDIITPDESFNCVRFKTIAENQIENIYKKGSIPLVVGGTGLYIKAITRGIFEWPGGNSPLKEDLKESETLSNLAKHKVISPLREELKTKSALFGPGYLHDELKRVDPISASHIHPHDQIKTIRALEVYLTTGTPISELQQRQTRRKNYTLIMIGLSLSRTSLYEQINKRVDKMMGSGLLDEVVKLMESGYSSELSSMSGLGYRHLIGYLTGKYDLQTAIFLFKRDTRRYAKRQITWFRHEPLIQWFNPEDKSAIFDFVQGEIGNC